MSRRTDTVLFLLVAGLVFTGLIGLATSGPSAPWSILDVLSEPVMSEASSEGFQESPAASEAKPSKHSFDRRTRPVPSPSGGPSVVHSDPLSGRTRSAGTRAPAPIAIPEPDLSASSWDTQPAGDSRPHSGGSGSARSFASSSAASPQFGAGISASASSGSLQQPSRSASVPKRPWTDDLDRLSGDLRQIGGHLAALNRERDRAERARRSAQAERSGAVTSNDNGPLPPKPTVPVDGGLGFLAAAGAAYAVRRLRNDTSAPA